MFLHIWDAPDYFYFVFSTINSQNIRIPHGVALTYEECVRLIKSFNLVITYGRDGTIMILDAEKLDA
ncbi:MAG: hypothetical protein V7L14_13775 [Nostoc sp.]|uniref:hypothetical protein n=1 Tax=Nostoc sp. TaxID=1180 RepID=UPI002FFA3369